MRIMSWDEIDESDVNEVQQGNCMYLKEKNTVVKVYMDHDTNKAWVAFPEEINEMETQKVRRVLEALHYIPMEVS